MVWDQRTMLRHRYGQRKRRQYRGQLGEQNKLFYSPYKSRVNNSTDDWSVSSAIAIGVRFYVFFCFAVETVTSRPRVVFDLCRRLANKLNGNQTKEIKNCSQMNNSHSMNCSWRIDSRNDCWYLTCSGSSLETNNFIHFKNGAIGPFVEIEKSSSRAGTQIVGNALSLIRL